MLLYIVVGIVVVSVIAGIFVALKGYNSEDSKAVPISDIKEFRPSLKDDNIVPFQSKFAATPIQPASVKPTLSQHLLKENLSVKPAQQPSFTQFNLNPSASSAPVGNNLKSSEPTTQDNDELIRLRQENANLKLKLENQINDAKEKIAQVVNEKNELSIALAQAFKNKETQTNKEAPQTNGEEENAKLQKKIEEIDELKKTLQTLTLEKDALAKLVETEKERALEADEKQKLLNQRLTDLEKEQLQFNQDLIKRNMDLQNLRSEADLKAKEALEARDQIVDLNKKLEESLLINRSMQEKLLTINNSHEIQISQSEYTSEQFEQEKEKLIFQLKVSELKVEELQKTVELLRQNIELKAQIETEQKQSQNLQPINKNLQGSTKGAAEEKLEWAVLNIEELKREKEKINQLNAELELRLAKIREHNAQLVKKESMLHYELSKSRAQAIGLEKICMSLKEQLDQAHKSTGII